MRLDGREKNQLRHMSAKVGIIDKADGSAYFRIGKTEVYAAVYGPKFMPKVIANQNEATFRAKYNMLPFSTTERKRPGVSRRDVELSLILEYALKPAIFLDEYPGTLIELFVEVSQADAGTRAAAITAASMALADAGIAMKDLVAAVAVGRINNELVLDLTKEEEDTENATDIPIAMMPRNGEITSLQLDGNISDEELLEAINLAREGINKIYNLQIKTLKERYESLNINFL